MTKQRMRFCFTTLLLAAIMIPCSHAQSAAPQAYSLTEVNTMMHSTRQVYRNGSKAVVDQTFPPSQPGSQGTRTRTLYDLERHASFTWNLVDTSQPCGGPAVWSGDWGDPFVSSAQTISDFAQAHPRQTGAETINGLATEVYEVATPQIKAKYWVDTQTGLIVRMDAAMGDQPMTTGSEIRQLTLVAPPASTFTLPPICAKAASQPLPLTEEQRIAKVTGGSAADYPNAIMPPIPPNPHPCNVSLRVVHAGTLALITSGFQVAIDTTSGYNAPEYSVGERTDGRVSYSGATIHEVTDQIRNGVLAIKNPPESFYLDVHVTKGSESSALIYRQCFRPETVLLFVPKEGAMDQGEWLWVKSGKPAN
jgi:hypothetical protein